nr:chaperonin [Archangium sp.]
MAKTATRKRGSVQRQGRRAMPTPRRSTHRRAAPALLTLGDLIAAAYDTAGGERFEVLKLVTSQQMSRALGRRIVLEG